jgi:hypothetical protein
MAAAAAAAPAPAAAAAVAAVADAKTDAEVEAKRLAAGYFCDHTSIRRTIAAMEAKDWLSARGKPDDRSEALQCTDLMADGPRIGKWCGLLLQSPWTRCLYHSKDATRGWAEKWRKEIRANETIAAL